MLATIVNALVILAGGVVGLLVGGRLKAEKTDTVVAALAICTLMLGVTGALKTASILVVILSLAVGSLLGELLQIEKGLDRLGDWLKSRVGKRGGGRFTEGFVTASLLFCVGSMAIMGSFDAGLRGDYSTIFAKAALDGVMSLTFAATMGVGVLFSAGTVLLYQGSLTLLAGVVEPFLSQAAVVEMTAVGGIMLIATGMNVLGLTKERLRVGNMLPSLLIPVIWFAIT